MFTTLDELMQALRYKLPDYLAEFVGHEVVIGKSFKCVNPEHQDNTPSMSLRDNVFCKCFGCSTSLDIFSAASLLEGKPSGGQDFVNENVYYLANKFGLKYNLLKKADEKQVALRWQYYRAHKIVADLIQEIADNNPTSAFNREFARRRWTRVKESIKCGLGCVHSFNDVLNALRNNGFTDEAIRALHLYRQDLFNTDNVIFTIYDENNKPIAFYARDVRFEEKKKEYIAQKSNTNNILTLVRPKKYNSSTNFTGIYEKPLYPYGIHDIRTHHKIIAVEGHSCKHSLKLSGVSNVIALGGSELSNYTIEKLASLGVTHITLCLDNDDVGRNKTKQIILQYYGKIAIDFSVISMHGDDVKDPDEFIRKHGIDVFKECSEKSAIEWMAIEFIKNNNDPYSVAKELAPIIALERSSLERLRIINLVIDIFNITSEDEKRILKKALSEEVDNKIAASQDRKSEYALKILDETRDMISNNPTALEAALGLLAHKLIDTEESKIDSDLYTSNEVLKGLISRKEKQESDSNEITIKTGFSTFDHVCPLPTGEAFCLIIAPPSSGKTSLLLSISKNILKSNQEAMVIMFTNDDSRDIYIDRLIALQTKLQINWVANPNKYLDADKKHIRNEAYNELSDLILKERLIIKDISHSNNVEYIGKLITYYRDKYPERNIVCTCDNLHRLNTELQIEEGRFKVKHISATLKSYTIKYNCVILSTVEMTKENMYEKPRDARSIAEAASLQFDANLILFLWNEINVLRDLAVQVHKYNAIEFFPNIGYVLKEKTGPIIEILFLKNKLSEFKGELFFNLYHELALYEETSEEVKQDIIKQKMLAEEHKKAESKKRGNFGNGSYN